MYLGRMKLAARPALVSSRLRSAPHVSFGHGFLQPSTRRLAMNANDGKSWGEIASDAAQVAKSAITKLKDSIQTAAGSLTKQESRSAPKPSRRDTPEDLLGSPPSSLLGGLVGRAVGGLLGSAMATLSKQMAETAKETSSVYEEAAFRIRNDDQVKAKFGSIQCSQPMSQSVSSSSINGRLTKNVNLLFLVYGSNGSTGQAQVRSSTDPSGKSTSDISVQLQSGEVIKVGGKSGVAGDTIDVDYWEVK